jgi:hypothetical protein
MSTWSILSAVNAVNLVNTVNEVKNRPLSGGVGIANDEFTIALIPRVISEKSPTMRPPTADAWGFGRH